MFGGLYKRVCDDVLLNEPRAGATVLDAGCGPGRLALRIATGRPDLRVHGVDLSAGMIEAAVARAGDRVEFTHADLADLPLPTDSVDLIVSTASYHHWEHVDPIVRELARVLRPDGMIWLYDLRPAPAGPFCDAVRAEMPDRVLRRSIIRTGRFPVALYQRVSVGRAG